MLSWFPTRSGLNNQGKIGRVLKFKIYEVEALYYLFSEKGTLVLSGKLQEPMLYVLQ